MFFIFQHATLLPESQLMHQELPQLSCSLLCNMYSYGAKYSLYKHRNLTACLSHSGQNKNLQSAQYWGSSTSINAFFFLKQTGRKYETRPKIQYQLSKYSTSPEEPRTWLILPVLLLTEEVYFSSSTHIQQAIGGLTVNRDLIWGSCHVTTCCSPVLSW